MTKRREYELPPVRIEPKLFADAMGHGAQLARRIRTEVQQHLEAAGDARPWQETIDRLLRDLLAGRDVSRHFSLSVGKRDSRAPRIAAIATEHARLVMRLMDQGATELGAAKRATAAIARKLGTSSKGVQRAVNGYWPRYVGADGRTVVIDPRRVIEKYEVDLAALDAKKKAHGPSK